MNRGRRAALGLLPLLVVAVLVVSAVSPRSEPPRSYLWAWERPEDLSFLEPREVGVALLAGTLRLEGERVYVQPRLQSITLPVGVHWIPVVRIETDPGVGLSEDPGQAMEVAGALIELFADWPSDEIQIDFDARLSERDFYRRVLESLRQAMPGETRIAITALASWCLGDPWIADLPIDDAIPMLFRMGEESAGVRRSLESGEDLRLEVCRSSLGLSTDEPLDGLASGRRAFLFHPRAWSRRAFEENRSRLGL